MRFAVGNNLHGVHTKQTIKKQKRLHMLWNSNLDPYKKINRGVRVHRKCNDHIRAITQVKHEAVAELKWTMLAILPDVLISTADDGRNHSGRHKIGTTGNLWENPMSRNGLMMIRRRKCCCSS